MSKHKEELAALQTDIIKRFLSEANYKSFIEEYKANRKIGRRSRVVNALDMKIYADHKKGLTLSELSEKYNKGRNQILYSLYLVSNQ